MADSFLSVIIAYWPFIAVVALALILSKTYFNRGLNRYPGPFLANFTDAWRVWDTSLNQHQHTMLGLHERHGPVIRTGPSTLDISDVEYVSKIYGIKSGFTKTAFYRPFVNVQQGKLRPSLLSILNESEHAAARKPVANLYALSTLQSYEPLVDEMIQLFMDRLEEEFDGPLTKGRPCDMAAWLQYYAFDVVLNLTFGNTLGYMAQGADAGGFIKTLEKTFDEIALCAQMPWLTYLWKQNPLRLWLLQQDNNIFPSFVRAQIAEHAAKLADEKQLPGNSNEFYTRNPPHSSGATDKPDQPKEDMLTRFMRALPADQVSRHALSNVVAGSDTTAITLRAILYFLLKHPSALQRLMAELRTADLSYPVTWKQSQHLPYLKSVIEESLRLFPAVGLQLERRVPVGGLVMPDGFVVSEGTNVGMNPWAVHRQSAAFGPLPTGEFRPERWLRGEGESEQEFDERLAKMRRADLAFGFGKRICIGRNISYLEIYKVIPTLLSEFEIELVSKEWKTINRWFVRQTEMDCMLRRRVRR